jgi:hypothetical protein
MRVWLRGTLFGLFTLACYWQGLYAIPGLVGVVNNCRKVNIKLNDTAGNLLVINSGGVRQFEPIVIPDCRAFSSNDQKWSKSLTISLEIDRGLEGIKQENVQIILHSEFENQLIVVVKGPNNVTREARITNAANSAHMLGLGANPWQGVFMAFKDEADYPYFSFAITSWASNRNEWLNAVGANFLKTKQTSDGKIAFKDRNNNDLYLRIIQGQQAYGGGIIPFPSRGHLVHIYNNTNYALLIKRVLESTSKTDSIIVPLQSVIPYAMEWIPERKLSQEDEKGFAVPGITISLLSAQSRARPPRIGEYLLKGGAGLAPVASTVDIKKIVDNMGFRSPDNAADVMTDIGFDRDVKSVFDLIMPAEVNTNFFSSKVQYKIWERETSKKIIIVARNVDEQINKIVMTSADDAYLDRVHPGYFYLVVTENNDISNPLKFTLVKMGAIDNPNVAPIVQ